jgi:hypothetical protein
MALLLTACPPDDDPDPPAPIDGKKPDSCEQQGGCRIGGVCQIC